MSLFWPEDNLISAPVTSFYQPINSKNLASDGIMTYGECDDPLRPLLWKCVHLGWCLTMRRPLPTDLPLYWLGCPDIQKITLLPFKTQYLILLRYSQSSFFRGTVFQCHRQAVREDPRSALADRIPKGTRIPDIGSGNGRRLLQDKDLILFPWIFTKGNNNDRVKPIVYDGKNIPWREKYTVWCLRNTGSSWPCSHHIDDPDAGFKRGAARVCKNLVIAEDIYENKVQHTTYFLDYSQFILFLSVYQ